MSSRERRRPADPSESTPATQERRPPTESQKLLAQCHDLLEIGDEICDRSLSGDSEAFLQQSRQEGGQ